MARQSPQAHHLSSRAPNMAVIRGPLWGEGLPEEKLVV